MKVDLVGVDLVRVDLMGVDLMCTHRVFLYSGVVLSDGRYRSTHSLASCQHAEQLSSLWCCATQKLSGYMYVMCAKLTHSVV